MGTISNGLRIRVLARDGYKCVYCGRTAAETGLEVDHVQPRAHGGSDHSTNLVSACYDCNRGKRDATLPLPAHVAPVAVETASPRARRPRRKSSPYRAEALRRWPDGMDMAWDGPVGDGRWATIAWCAGVSVGLWSDESRARAWVEGQDSCGHGCWRDHELVDLEMPELIDREHESHRLAQRLAHFAFCRTCSFVFSGQAAAAAERRARRRMGAR